MFKHFINNWFQYALALVCVGTFSLTSKFGGQINAKRCIVEADRPSCYIYYGIAQNDIKKEGGKLRVNSLIENFPKRPHQVYVEIIDSKGEIDFLYSEAHSPSHKAHLCPGRCQRQYKATYKIPKVDLGTYKLRITFKFKYLLGTKDIVSNDIIFKVK